MPPVRLATSMRVQDSLEQGVSYFMAELRGLKAVVDAAEEARSNGSRLLVFLLDEILHGTNTAERQIAARAVLHHLLDLGATGAVSTHDLGLVDTPALDGKHHDVYFTEQFTRGPEGAAIAFDYRLRPGLAQTTNALKLMEIVGLPVDDVEVVQAGNGETIQPPSDDMGHAELGAPQGQDEDGDMPKGLVADPVVPGQAGDEEVAGLKSDTP
jgi:DNA mismatch repair ATPase MutS